MKRLPALCFFFFLSAVMTGCMPSVEEVLARHDRNIVAGQAGNSIPELLEMAEEGDSEDFLLWRLLAGSSASLAGQDALSIAQFDLAEDIFNANDASSFASNTSAFLVNERIVPYRGSGQERIFCCFYKALLYAACNDRDAARTELNRTMEHQENWLFARRKELSAAGKAMKEAAAAGKNSDHQRNLSAADNAVKNESVISLLAEHCAFNMHKSGDLSKLTPADYQNAYVTHFCGIYRWLNGDSGTDYLRDAARLLPDNPLIAADLANAENAVPVKNTVWIYIEDGLCPVRYAARFDLPLFLIPYAHRFILYAGMALPALRYREKGSEKYHVAGREFILLENIDRLLKTDFDVYMFGAVRREITRCMTRSAAQVAAGIIAENARDNDAVYWSLRAAQLSAAAYAAATTKADLRCWTALPKRVLFQRIPRPSDGKISVAGGNSRIDITLPAGNSILWLRKTSQAAPFQAKLISFP